MKFAKVLSDQAATVLPGALQSLFPYKALKKDMKVWAAGLEADDSSDDSCRRARLANVQHELLRLLGSELRHLNQIFMEREELLVISWQLLSEEVSRTVPMQHLQQHAAPAHGHQSSGDLQQQQQQQGLPNGCTGASPLPCCHGACADADQLQDLLQLLVNFHGDAVLLMNWSHVNYNAVAKALKKFDKKFGTALRAPVMQQVVAQSFCSTGVVSSLTHRAEQLVNQLTTHLQEAASSSRAPGGSHRGVVSSHRAATQGPAPHTSPHILAPESPQKTSSGSPTSGKRPREGSAVSHKARAAAPAATAAVTGPRGRRSVESASRRSSEDVAFVPGEAAGQMAQCAVMSRRVQAALDTWHTLAVGASTPSTVVTGPAASAVAAYGAMQ